MPGPSGGGDFLEQLLGDLLGLMGSSAAGGAEQLELARTLARSVASGNQPEVNVEPLARIELEGLARVAELHISELTGLPVTPSGAPVEIMTVSPGLWAWHTLEDWRFLLEAMSSPSLSQDTSDTSEAGRSPNDTTGGGSLTNSDDSHRATGEDLRDASGPSALRGSGEPGNIDGEGGAEQSLGLADLDPSPEPWERSEPSGPADLVARFMSTMGPMLAAMQLGSVVGHLARSVLGQYDVPIPRPASRLLIVPQNIERFANDWALPRDQVQLWVCLRELSAHAVLTRSHVASRWKELLTNVVRAVAEDSASVLDRLGTLDPTDPEALQSLLGDPEALLGTSPSSTRRRAADELEAVTAALMGYVEYVLDQAASRLLGGRTALAEAWRRRQLDRETTDRAAELLFGLDLGPAQVERGVAFVSGVLERAGEEGLGMLWSAKHALPTPPEIDAPGLWLERVRLTGG
jgi:putative hydrolase